MRGPGSWLNLSDNFHAMKDGSLIWWSERSRAMAICTIMRTGRMVTQLTSGRVGGEERWSASTRRSGGCISLANRDTPLEEQLYSVDIDAAERALTPLTQTGMGPTTR